MAVAFARTMRSLSADDFRSPRILGILAVILGVAWFWWFFTAQAPRYAVSADARLETDTRVVADFPATAFPRIQIGQAARFRTSEASFRGQVSRVQDRQDGRVRVEIALNTPAGLPFGVPGTVEIEIERLSVARTLQSALSAR
jgi:hypothetical protein